MLREERIKGSIRCFCWIPTSAMLADALTKPMLSSILFDLLTHGYWNFDSKNFDPLRGKELRLFKYTEQDLIDIQNVPANVTHVHYTDDQSVTYWLERGPLYPRSSGGQ